MHIVQLLLPLCDGAGAPLARSLFDSVRRELVDRFGGLTAYSRAPAKGLWDDGSEVERDDIVVFEIMADALDRDWWSRYRETLEERFDQRELTVRALAAEKL